MKKLVFCAIASLLLLSSIVAAEIPKYVTVQGRLSSTTTDEPFSGSYRLLFDFYDVETGGSSLWSYEKSNVPIDKGMFNTEIDLTTAPSSLDFSKPYWIEVSTAPTGQTLQKLSPRIKLTTSAYAFAAGRLYATGNLNVGGKTSISYPLPTWIDINCAGWDAVGEVCNVNFDTGYTSVMVAVRPDAMSDVFGIGFYTDVNGGGTKIGEISVPISYCKDAANTYWNPVNIPVMLPTGTKSIKIERGGGCYKTQEYTDNIKIMGYFR